MANGGRPDVEERLLRRLQLIAGATFLVMIVLMVLIDNFGRLLIDPSFHVSEVLFGTSVGALLGLVGVSALAKVPRKGS